MAKTIKFNLILDDKPVRNIEDLKENFSIEDILELYNNGLLQRWLNVRGYSEFLEKVNSIEADSNIQIIKELIKIFQIEIDEENIREGISILEYINERRIQLEEYNELNFKAQEVIELYHSGYRDLINKIIENADDMAKIKAYIKETEKNYIRLFDLNFYDLYFELIDKAPLAIFAILMNNKLRNYFISKNDSKSFSVPSLASSSGFYDIIKKGRRYEEGSSKVDDDTKQLHIKEINELISEYIEFNNDLISKLGKHIKKFKGITNQYWKPIESKGKKYMIIKIEEGNFVRNLGRDGEEYGACDVNDNFIILDGIDYMSNYENDELLYMEV